MRERQRGGRKKQKKDGVDVRSIIRSIIHGIIASILVVTRFGVACRGERNEGSPEHSEEDVLPEVP